MITNKRNVYETMINHRDSTMNNDRIESWERKKMKILEMLYSIDQNVKLDQISVLDDLDITWHLFKCWIRCTFVILFFVFRQFRFETINRFFFSIDERFVRDFDASLNDVRLNDCKDEKINSKFCEIDFVREIDSSKILKTSNRNV